jgi:hypothetical protein
MRRRRYFRFPHIEGYGLQPVHRIRKIGWASPPRLSREIEGDFASGRRVVYRSDVMETDQIYVLAFAVFRYFQQIEDAEKA